jgi:ribosomal protein uS17
MADEKDIEETAETTPEPEAGETPAAVAEETAAAQEPAEDSAVEDSAAEDSAAAEPSAEEAAEATPAAEQETAPEAPAEKRTRSQRHVPRSQRRQRSKPAREKSATRKPIVRLPKPESEPGRRQERRGVVVSDKGDKTIVVKVDVMKTHPRYKKVVRRSVKFHAHDEGNSAGVGDTVRIVETRPLSKTKRWRLAEIVEKAR